MFIHSFGYSLMSSCAPLFHQQVLLSVRPWLGCWVCGEVGGGVGSASQSLWAEGCGRDWVYGEVGGGVGSASQSLWAEGCGRDWV